MKAMFVILAAALLGSALASPVQEVKVVSHPFACEQEDPLIVPPGNMNLTLHPIVSLNEGSNHNGLVAAGLSGLVAEVNIIIITLTANFKVDIPSLDVDVTGADAEGYLDLRPFTSFPAGNFTGSGDATIDISALHLEGSATLFINIIGNRVNVRALSITVFRFDVLCLDFGSDFTIGGSPVDWVDFCANVKSRFDAEFANTQLKNQLVEKIRVAANVIVSQYTLDELLDLIGGGDDEPCDPTPMPRIAA